MQSKENTEELLEDFSEKVKNWEVKQSKPINLFKKGVYVITSAYHIILYFMTVSSALYMQQLMELVSHVFIGTWTITCTFASLKWMILRK